MAPRKTGTVTGANLEKSNKGKKGGLTGSKRVTGESSTPISTPVSTQENTPQPTEQPITSLGIPTPPSVGEKLKEMANGAASAIEKGAATVNAVQGYVSRVSESIKGTDNDRNPHAITNGQVNTADILARASAEIDENVPQMDSAEATKRNIIIARQRNYVGVAINNTKLKQDLATLDLEQQRLIGLLIDGKTAQVTNEKKAVTYHRAVVGRDTELSKLEQDRELLTQQQIRTEGTQAQTSLIQEQEQLKVAKLREEIEKQGYEIQAISYEKEKLKQETEAKFLAGF
jgi:SHS2 domain-containing protein